LGGDRQVWVAASTHEGEDEQILDVHKRLLQGIPGLLLVLVPRHPERFDRVFSLLGTNGLTGERRSQTNLVSPDTQVYVGDTMGELLLFLAAADAAFVGGSLVNTGGHNVLEASMFGVPVCFGPHMFNFQAISQMLIEQQAAVRIANQDELYQTMDFWLRNASERSRIGENGLRVVENNRGALQRLTNLLAEYL
jgi:3-deoxy-D-manno-octulosonic-acid transferase